MNMKQDPKEQNSSKEGSDFDAAIENDAALLDQIALGELDNPEIFDKLNGDDDEQW